MKREISMIDFKNDKQALVCLLFVYLLSWFWFPFLNDKYRLLIPADIVVSLHADSECNL